MTRDGPDFSLISMVKPFLEQKTHKKVRFVYSNNPESQKIMLELFDMDKLESAFGGRNQNGFDFLNFADRMKEDDKKMTTLLSSRGSILSQQGQNQDQSLESARRRSISSLSDAHSDQDYLSGASSSPDATSPKLGGNEKLEKNGVNGMLDHKSSVGDQAELLIEGIQIKESI